MLATNIFIASRTNSSCCFVAFQQMKAIGELALGLNNAAIITKAAQWIIHELRKYPSIKSQ